MGYVCWMLGTPLMLLLPFLIFWIIISPSSVKFHVTEASLTHFNLTSNNTLYFKFKVDISARNPNNNVKVYYRRIKAIAWYKDNDFGWVSLTPFDQGHKNTSFLEPIVFEGHSAMKLKPRQIAEYNEETRVGVYNDLAVDLDLRIRAKYGGIKGRRFNPPIVRCRRLRVPLISSDESTPPLNRTSCSSSYFFLVVIVVIIVVISCDVGQSKSHGKLQTNILHVGVMT
ncbi:NDR1/HIN1-like protein 10 [Lotus japonicus]|uniref:NDR1/HIN1-like protein 10 n=1 Tax=Lotus japonicus TaxID=34305 RepID=UPI00258336AD|nr:NDR1/HIN1-like protein 10 [Lotus japonicus]